MRQMHRGFHLCFLVIATLPGTASAMDVSLFTELTRGNNINNAGFSGDERNDTSLLAEVGLRFEPALQTAGVLSFTGNLGARVYDRYTGLNQIEAVLGAQYTQRIGLGPGVPWWQIAGEFSIRSVDDSQRDAYGGLLTLGLGKALTDRLDGRAWLSADFQDGEGNRSNDPAQAFRGGEVYDLSGWQVGTELTYWFSDLLAGFVNLSYRDGDVNSSSTVTLPEGYARLRDPVFDMVTYRAGAEVIDARFGLSYGISERGTVSLDYRFIQARSDIPTTYSYRRYDSSFVSLGFHYAF
jgi:hypothetical protein